MKKFLSVSLAVTTILWLVGTVYVPVAKAAVVDGDVVSPDATFTEDGITYYPYDVFIIKIVGSKTFKRLVLNPQVFDSYGHLKWSNIKKISAATVDGYITSSLVREINDTKVYKLIPDGDTGTKQWVETLDCFNSKGYDWDSVYIINATDRDNYTTGTSVCGGGGEGALTLSLASDTPAAATIPPNAQGVTFMKVNVAGTGTISQIVFKRLGAGSIDDFGDLYVYQNGVRLTSGRTISSATSKATFIGLKLAAPTTFELVVDMSTGQAGNVNYFVIESASDITADGTVGGTFPINGNPMGISGTNAGTVTVERSGTSSRTVTIGAKEVEISQFRITTATEGANFYRIHLFNSGTGENTKITNLKLKDHSGNLLATADKISDSGYLTFVLNTPFYIKKGDNHIFHIYGDVGAVKPEQTIILYLELTTDILVKGTTYGFGMAATITSYDSDTAITVTCKGGDLTLNKVGPNATKIGTATQDTVFLDFTMSAAADITIKKTRLFICIDADANGYYDWAILASTTAGADIEDIKIKDKDTGVVLVGPKDGTSFNDGEVDNACPSNTDAVYEDYTDTFDIVAGETKNLQITADIKTANTDSGAVISSGDIVKLYLYSYATLVTSTGNVNIMKYTGTSDAVDDSAIAPSGHIAGDEMTVEGATLTLALAASPSGSSGSSPADNKTYIKGQSGVSAAGIIFEAGKASDITVSGITLTGYISEDGGNAAEWFSGQDANHYVKDTVAKVYIYDTTTGELVPGSTGKAFSGSTVYELVEYTGLNWTIPAGESRTLLVKVDLSSASPASAATADTFIAFDIEGNSDVTSVDKDGNSITITTAGRNGGSSTDASVNPNTDFGVAKYGALAVSTASDTPDKNIAVMGTTDNEVSKFKLTGTSEAWYIEKFSVLLNDGQESGEPDSANRDNFSAIKLKYQTATQWGTSSWTISSGKTFGANASLAFSFTGSDRIYVPKDDNSYLTVLASIADYSGGTGAKSKVPFKLLTMEGSASSFSAYGAQSGEQLVSFTQPTESDFNLQFVARSKPVFAKSAWSGSELELARFTITAVGYDVIFDGTPGTSHYDLNDADPASACLQFDVVASSTDDAIGAVYMYDWNENIVASIASITWNDTTYNASISFAFEVKDVTVPSGTTKEFHVDLNSADLVDFQDTDEYLYLQLKNDDGGSLATGSYGYGARNIIYHDGSNEEGITSTGSGDANVDARYGMPALIKNIGPLPITFRTIRGTGTP